MGVNKFVYNNEIKFDLTGDTVTADRLLSGTTAHDNSGTSITGTCTYDADTSDATVAQSEILNGKTAYARGAKVTGTMPNIGTQTSTITTKAQSVSISAGYHDGSGAVAISATEQAKLVANNIRKGVTILGVEGNIDEDEENPQPTVTVTPSFTKQDIVPSVGYTCLREVVVNAIPYREVANATGTTIIIG